MQHSLLHIFMADDDPDDIDLFREALSELSKDAILTTGSNGSKILSMLRQVTPDLIFLDVNMPVMNGMDCLAKIRDISSLREVPVIIYSTAANDTGVTQCFQLGANRYIKKPASFTGIKSALQEILTQPLRSLIHAKHPGNFFRPAP